MTKWIMPMWVSVALAACGNDVSSSYSTRVAQLQGDVDSLKVLVAGLQQKLEINEMFEDWDKVAYMTPGLDGYSVVQSDLGPMTVSLENVQPYANGSRVTLQFGNLSSATIDGAKAKIEWGKVDSKGLAINDTTNHREVTFTKQLRAGAWTQVPVVIERVPPTDLGFVRIRNVTHAGIRLAR